jgi:uncharacterized protein YndB with AHSA1/START domain
MAHSLRVERTYEAPAQAVFDAWTSPDVMRRWWHAGDASWETRVAEADLRVGGGYQVTMRAPGGAEYTARGDYTVVDPPRRLAFHWTWDGDDPNETLIDIEFTERDGATTVVLTQSGLSSESSREGHTGGWQEALENLSHELEA